MILEGILPDKIYQHFLLLHISITILLSKLLTKNYGYLAKSLLKMFVAECTELYGKSFNIYYMHRAIHIADDAIRFTTLDKCSAFRFENYVGKLKRMIRKGNNVVEQLVARIDENSLINYKSKSNKNAIKVNDCYQLNDHCYVIINNINSLTNICEVRKFNTIYSYSHPISSSLLGQQKSDIYIISSIHADVLLKRCLYIDDGKYHIFKTIVHYFDL